MPVGGHVELLGQPVHHARSPQPPEATAFLRFGSLPLALALMLYPSRGVASHGPTASDSASSPSTYARLGWHDTARPDPMLATSSPPVQPWRARTAHTRLSPENAAMLVPPASILGSPATAERAMTQPLPRVSLIDMTLILWTAPFLTECERAVVPHHPRGPYARLLRQA